MKPLVTAADLARYQADAVLGLTGTCSLLRKTDSDEGWGGQGSSYVTIATDVPCSVVGIIGGTIERALQGKLTNVTSYRINLPISVVQEHTITESDRVQTSGTTYEIRALLADPSPLILPLTCPVLAEEVT